MNNKNSIIINDKEIVVPISLNNNDLFEYLFFNLLNNASLKLVNWLSF